MKGHLTQILGAFLFACAVFLYAILKAQRDGAGHD
jgi:hypothetical protein